METRLYYLIAADAMLITHALFVVFVVLGLLLIFVGKLFAWSWVHNFNFRCIHLVAIGVVVLQSWLGMICPLTIWEMSLRAKAGDTVYTGSFIAHWLQTLLFYRAPEWVFILLYTLFGALVIASWYWVRPKRR
jgi:hypothetical protein